MFTIDFYSTENRHQNIGLADDCWLCAINQANEIF